MDDVKEVQVNKLLGIEMNGFNTNGSKVILIGHNWQDFINVVHEDGKVEMEFLHLEKALELFSHKAFGESKPSYAFVKIAKEVVNACGGLPLSLEVMGSWFCTKHFFILWEEALSRLKHVQLLGGGNENEKLWCPLKINFEDLIDEEREMFLDIACIFSDDEFDLEVGKALQIWSGPQSSP
jgi:hypothetical protein